MIRTSLLIMSVSLRCLKMRLAVQCSSWGPHGAGEHRGISVKNTVGLPVEERRTHPLNGAHMINSSPLDRKNTEVGQNNEDSRFSKGSGDSL